MALSPVSSVRSGMPLGLTGATAATRYVGATSSGAPASGTFAVGDFIIDQTGKVYVCTVAGTPGTWTQASGSSATVVTKLADESVSSSTTLQADDELLFATVNLAVYQVDLSVFYNSPAGGSTPDIKYGVGEDGFTRGIMQVTRWDTSEVPGITTYAMSTASSTASNTGTIGATTFTRTLRFFGMYVAAGGTCAFYWAQNTSDSNPTVVKAGSTLTYTRLA